MADSAEVGLSTVHVLSRDGDVKLLQAALKGGASPSSPDADGMTPLHYAAWYGNPLCLLALLSAGADLDTYDHDGSTALHAAAFNGQLGCVVVLAEAGARVGCTNNESQSPITVAMAEKHHDIAAFLRIIHRDQELEGALEEARLALADAEAAFKAFKPELNRVLKEARKRVGETEKEAKRIRNETIRLQKGGKKRAAKKAVSESTFEPAAAGSPFSQMGMGGGAEASKLSTLRRESGGAKSSPAAGRRTSSTGSAAPRTPSRDSSGAEPAAARALPDVPKVDSAVAADMVLAQYQADTEDESEILVNFLASLDLKDFSRVLLKAGMTLEALQACQNADLQRLGLPTTARRRILAKLNPT